MEHNPAGHPITPGVSHLWWALFPVKDSTIKDYVGNLLVAYTAPTDDLVRFVATSLAMHAGDPLCGLGIASGECCDAEHPFEYRSAGPPGDCSR